jgi:tetratricopeptide (TPR) repeat protein
MFKKTTRFYNAITSVKALDITKCSLRKLIKEQSKSSEVPDLTDAFELSAWNEIIEFKSRIEDGEVDSTLYQQMGEKFFELGESKQAMEALDMSTDINPKNGISWAIKSLIYQSKLIENNNSHYQSLALTEFSGEILNPITAEEYWINERVDDTLNDLVNVKRIFVKTAINALTHWPAWETPHTYSDAAGKPNFYRTLNQDFNTDIELKREYLFRRLLAEVNVVEFGQHENEITDIVRSFQMWSKDIHASSGIVYSGKSRDKENFFKVLSWISKQETKSLMDNYFKDCLKNPYKAKDNQELLRSPVVKALYINLMDRTEYKNLLDKLLKLDLRHQQLENFNNVTTDHFYDVDSKLT